MEGPLAHGSWAPSRSGHRWPGRRGRPAWAARKPSRGVPHVVGSRAVARGAQTAGEIEVDPQSSACGCPSSSPRTWGDTIVGVPAGAPAAALPLTAFGPGGRPPPVGSEKLAYVA